MKKRISFGVLLGVLLLALSMAGCSGTVQTQDITATSVNPTVDQELPMVDQFESVRQIVDDYLAHGEIGAMTPEELYEIIEQKNADYFLVDIRANQDFVNSNIKGSVCVPYAQTSNPERLESLPKDKNIVVIDYNGHQAAQTAATWSQLGFKAVPLLYGIQSWTQEDSPRGYEAFPVQPLKYPLVTGSEVISPANDTVPEIKYPEKRTDEYITETTRVYLDRNYKGVVTAEDLASEIQQGSGSTYLVDIREPQHYQLGHIEGSVNIPLADLASSDKVKTLPLDRRIVLIGYDGMDASLGARSLVTLGYDSVALKYGMSYWSEDEQITGVAPVGNLVKDYYELIPLNYVQPSAGAAGCG
ncbi:Rhodanese-related sulfurtransferase [Desulfitobacterium dichloroeliminans LMG P-21439]|uniref:Rhodanese-related sulfurtransferase n=1 Tax=Desulfitobacterium dichloroeliminans (strain LMG P-21439 / DCA1) TaxID=871963 RepID=L0F727_DESDL|nr:rhodanese-like domain-containing protein [Desulfitobacterium dichloroeliminans]AGA68763.1 Rhodanese-related sulfurtransferase [Desulfitobacterium dichloroeliminans LMG P-21439]